MNTMKMGYGVYDLGLGIDHDEQEREYEKSHGMDCTGYSPRARLTVEVAEASWVRM